MRTIKNEMLRDFENHLILDELSEATVYKYICDARSFARFAAGREVTKTLVAEYKRRLLGEGYAPSSVNSKLTSINRFTAFLGWYECRVKTLKLQKQVFCGEDKELTKAEYERLIGAAKHRRNERLSLIIETICATGIRVSELRFITAEAVKRGKAVVNCKGKVRTVFIVSALRQKLIDYLSSHNISRGSVFVTRGGRAVDRSNIWRDMKNLCLDADVDPQKVFPHNLRHLFARTFYGVEKDIARLADILGHSSINTTRIYMIETGEEHRKKLERMALVI